MSAELNHAADGQAELCPEIAVRNLDVIDYLANTCKWCGEVIFNSSTKPRTFCNNNNLCCNNYSRRGVGKKVWDALKRAKRCLVVDDTPSFAPTMVNKRIKTTFTDGQGGFKSVDVCRVEPMRLFPSTRKQRGVGVCPKGKELGVNTVLPEPTPVGGMFERNAVHRRKK